MSHYLPEQGDVVMIDFDPATGREIQKRRPALVMSKSIMAKHTGLVLVCPITSTVRGTELENAIDILEQSDYRLDELLDTPHLARQRLVCAWACDLVQRHFDLRGYIRPYTASPALFAVDADGGDREEN